MVTIQWRSNPNNAYFHMTIDDIRSYYIIRTQPVRYMCMRCACMVLTCSCILVATMV